MAYTFDITPSESYLQTASAPSVHATTRLDISLWFKAGNVTDRHNLLLIQFDDPDGNLYALVAHGDVAGDPVRFYSKREGTNYTVNTPTGFSAGTWHHVWVGVNRSTNRLAISIDGGTAATTESAKFPNGSPSYVRISGGTGFTPAIQGSIAEVALFDAAVDITSLTKAAPLVVNTANCIGYWPLIRELDDLAGGNDLTAYNSPTVSAHVPLIR